MGTTSLRAGSRISSLVCGGLALLGAISSTFAWVTLGHAYDLLAAMSFVAIAPVWYLRPLSFTTPIRQALKPRPEPLPQWAITLTTVGLTLLGASMVVRWAT
jgi:hypothetical protein